MQRHTACAVQPHIWTSRCLHWDVRRGRTSVARGRLERAAPAVDNVSGPMCCRELAPSEGTRRICAAEPHMHSAADEAMRSDQC